MRDAHSAGRPGSSASSLQELVVDSDERKFHAPATALQSILSLNAVLVVATCVGYLAASSMLILLNKFLLSEDAFSYPLILSGSGMVFTCIGSSLIVNIPAIVPDRQVITRDTYVRKILPLGFCSAATLALGNMAYLYLEVGLVQMLKSCCPVFVLLVALILRLETVSLPLIASVTLIAGGTATTAATGVSAISGVGLLIQLLSEMCEAFRLCLAQMLMCNLRLHQFEALRQMSSACIVFLSVGVWILEWERFCQEQAWRRIVAHPHWYIAAASLGFLLNLLAFAVIKLTGSVTQKVLGTVKNVCLVIFSVLFMNEQVSWRQWIGAIQDFLRTALLILFRLEPGAERSGLQVTKSAWLVLYGINNRSWYKPPMQQKAQLSEHQGLPTRHQTRCLQQLQSSPDDHRDKQQP